MFLSLGDTVSDTRPGPEEACRGREIAETLAQATSRRSDFSGLIHNRAYRCGTNGYSEYTQKTATSSGWQVIGR